tara:strand:+ start:274 stop:1203 length:930 start_codon:yes stop_codon:yes gene_type:complete
MFQPKHLPVFALSLLAFGCNSTQALETAGHKQLASSGSDGEHRADPSYSTTYLHPVYYTADFCQACAIGHEDSAPGQSNLLFITNKEIDPTTGIEYTSRLEFAASFRILDVRSRCANDFVVLGTSPGGLSILERWLITPPDGSYEAQHSMSAPTNGVSIPIASPTLPTIKGGTFIPPDTRPGTDSTRRALIYKSDPGESIRDFDIDVDGRFILVLDDNDGVKQVMQDGNFVTHIVPGTENAPTGGTPLDSVTISCDAQFGRVVLIGAGSEDYVGVLIDSNNDAYFEHVQDLTSDGYSNFGISFMDREDY